MTKTNVKYVNNKLMEQCKVVMLGEFNDTWYAWDEHANESDENGKYIDRINVEYYKKKEMVRHEYTKEWIPLTILVLPHKSLKVVNELEYPKHPKYPNSIYEYAHAVSMIEEEVQQ